MSPDRDDELADLLDDLSDTLRQLESEVGPDRPRSGPFGLPPPPSPRDVMRFTGEYAIPTAIAVLRANIKILELLGKLLRAGATADESRQRAGETVDKLRGETVSQLDRALSEIQQAVEEGDLPQTPEARNVVEEARRLNADLREYVREADERVRSERKAERDADRRIDREDERESRDGTTIPIEDRPAEDRSNESSVEIDVDEELESIKEGMGKSEENTADGEDEGVAEGDEAVEGHDGDEDENGNGIEGDGTDQTDESVDRDDTDPDGNGVA